MLYHHENLDGTGFPFGLKWRCLSAFVRTLRIVDAFDIWSRGLYTELAVTLAMEELYLWSGILLDEQWLDRFHQLISETIRSKPLQLDAISRM